jgi:hypothetical protein
MTDEKAEIAAQPGEEAACRAPKAYEPWFWPGFGVGWWFHDRWNDDHGPFDTEELCRLRAGFVMACHEDLVAEAHENAEIAPRTANEEGV